MKNFLKYVAALAIVGAFFVACSDWTDPEREITQHPDQQSPILRDNAYYQALREYKKTKHKIAFGWYGSWTAHPTRPACRVLPTRWISSPSGASGIR
mgnify:CR=1 FL=1